MAKQTVQVTRVVTKKKALQQPSANTSGNNNRCPTCGKFMKKG